MRMRHKLCYTTYRRMRMREDLKIYTGKCHEDTGKPSKILVALCKCSKISVTFAHVRNQIQKVMDNGPENPGTRRVLFT